MTNKPTVTLTVRGAEKRDGGRGIARIADGARQKLGVLSGDTVAVEGNETTVVKVWPASSTVPENTIQIDAETRTNAGVRIGDEVAVHPISVSDADSITVVPKATFSMDDVDTLERAVKHELLDRPVQSGEQARIERLGDAGLFVVSRTNPGEPSA